jgi:non-specific serine/threonine protein kinase/serine/threonine-protein kinase
MDPERYGRLRRLFAEARRLRGEARAKFVERECADDADMRRELEELLAQEADSKHDAMNVLEVDIARAARDLGSAGEPTLPGKIGRYSILGILGEGGMGTVYRAEQTEPIRREVALKLMRQSMLSPAMRARFENERQTLALMDHPHIAKVFDADYDEHRRPYLGMELVDGPSIIDYCRGRDLSVRQRLGLFLDVCRGVGHAHRKGVIHRDLKPSNVLVREAGGRPVPKLIDFSIAKSLEQPADEVHRTRTGQVIGTLDYMSPEQARGEIAAVDTRSDVYSLGVIAYELLSGRTPHEVSRMPLHEAVRRLSDDAVTGLKSVTGGTTGTDRVPSDVATIVEKCLSKDPERRYRNADELADDLERFLDSRPIRARRPSAVYQTRMLVAGHRLAFSFVAVGFVLLVAGLYGYEGRPDDAEKMVVETLDALTDTVGEDHPTTLRASTAMVLRHEHVGRFEEGLRLGQRTVERQRRVLGHDHRDTLATARTVGVILNELQRYDEACEAYESVHDIQRRTQGQDHPETLMTAQRLAEALFNCDRPDESVAMFRENLERRRRVLGADHPDTLKTMHMLGWALGSRGKFLEAGEQWQEAYERRGHVLGEDHMATLSSKSNLALVLGILGLTERGVAEYREIVETLERTVGYGHPMHDEMTDALAEMLIQNDDLDQAEAVLVRRVSDHEADPDTRNSLVAQWLLARVYGRMGRFDEALVLTDRVIDGRTRTLGPNHAETLVARADQVALLAKAGRQREARAEAEELLRIRLSEHGEEDERTADAHWLLADVELGLGHDDEARIHLDRALAISEKLFEDDPAELEYRTARHRIALGDLERGLESLRSAIRDGFYRVDRLTADRFGPLGAIDGDPRFEALVRDLVERNRVGLSSKYEI